MSKLKILNASLLIVGTSIGAGMLGLPVVASTAGFFPSFAMLVAIWLVMTATAFALANVLEKAESGANFVSLSEHFSGKKLKLLTFSVYILLFLSLSFAYAKGGGVFISDILPETSVTTGVAIFLLLFVPLITFGASLLSSINNLLVFVLFFSFFTLIYLGVTHINPHLLGTHNWSESSKTLPLFIASFGFHSILPSVKEYVGNKKWLHCAIIIGTTTTLLIYTVWNFFVLGIVPEEELTLAHLNDQTAIIPLKNLLNSSLLTTSAQAFYFSALATSFLGVGLGLIDFFLDAFSLKRGLYSRVLLSLLIYVPAFFAAKTSLRIFYLSLEYGGGPACFYLLIFLPIFLYLRLLKTSK